MRISKEKYMLARARACMSTKDLIKAGIPKGTLSTVLQRNIKPETAGKIAYVLGVDVTEILEKE